MGYQDGMTARKGEAEVVLFSLVKRRLSDDLIATQGLKVRSWNHILELTTKYTKRQTLQLAAWTVQFGHWLGEKSLGMQ